MLPDYARCHDWGYAKCFDNGWLRAGAHGDLDPLIVAAAGRGLGVDPLRDHRQVGAQAIERDRRLQPAIPLNA